MNVHSKTKWMYVGGQQGFGLVHTVGHVEGDEINAWSDTEQGREDGPGLAWVGSKAQFLREFKPVGFPGETGVPSG